MTDKEFKRLSRSQLIDIIYQFQLQVDKLTEALNNNTVALTEIKTMLKERDTDD